MLWWPFHTVQRVIAWEARAMRPSDYKPGTTGTQKKFKPRPYQPTFPAFMGSTLPARIIAAYGYLLIGTWPDWLVAMMGKGKPTQETQQLVEGVFPAMYPKMLNMFFPETTKKNPPQKFWDNWSTGLMMDQVEFSDELFNMVYTEIWVDLKDADRVINAFQSHYTADGVKATWFYCVEILGGKSSDFWLHPGYGRDSLRLSINWWSKNNEKTMDYYQQFWDLLNKQGIPFRLHWGKYLAPATSATGAVYLKQQFPRWSDFMALRKKMDPDNIFLNSYWRDQLAIS
jgi:D-arabinono-1,4-lactone oxidase